jgi:hypothetical protein
MTQQIPVRVERYRLLRVQKKIAAPGISPEAAPFKSSKDQPGG